VAHIWAPVAREVLREQVRSCAAIYIYLSYYIYAYIYMERDMMQQYRNLAHVWAPVA